MLSNVSRDKDASVRISALRLWHAAQSEPNTSWITDEMADGSYASLTRGSGLIGDNVCKNVAAEPLW